MCVNPRQMLPAQVEYLLTVASPRDDFADLAPGLGDRGAPNPFSVLGYALNCVLILPVGR